MGSVDLCCHLKLRRVSAWDAQLFVPLCRRPVSCALTVLSNTTISERQSVEDAALPPSPRGTLCHRGALPLLPVTSCKPSAPSASDVSLLTPLTAKQRPPPPPPPPKPFKSHHSCLRSPSSSDEQRRRRELDRGKGSRLPVPYLERLPDSIKSPLQLWRRCRPPTASLLSLSGSALPVGDGGKR